MKNQHNKTKSFIPNILILFLGTLIIWILFLLNFFWQPLERYSPSSLYFKNSCDSLNGKDFTFENIKILHGYCFESCGVSCTHAVVCTQNHLSQRIPTLPYFTVTQNPGAPEGYYCRITTDGQNKMNTTREFVTD